jgi:hypothetical protein
VLHVHDDVDEVQQHPPALALAFTAYRLDPQLQQAFLDRVDNGLDRPLVRCAGQHETVGDHELLADVDDREVGGELVRRGSGGSLGELDAASGCGHCCTAYGL